MKVFAGEAPEVTRKLQFKGPLQLYTYIVVQTPTLGPYRWHMTLCVCEYGGVVYN